MSDSSHVIVGGEFVFGWKNTKNAFVQIVVDLGQSIKSLVVVGPMG